MYAMLDAMRDTMHGGKMLPTVFSKETPFV